MLHCGAMPGAKVQRIVSIYTVGCRCETAILRQLIENRKKLVFAKKTAVRRIGAIRGIIHFVRFDEFVMNAEGADEFVDRGAIVRGKARRNRSHRQCALAKRFLRGPREVSRICAT